MTTTAAEPAASREQLQAEALCALEELMAHHWRQSPGGRWARRDLSVAQMHLLMVLQELGPATVGRLAEALEISPPSVSSALDRLEEHGLAVRRRDQDDRRVVHAALSGRGRAAAEEACGFRRQKVRHLVGQFNAGEMEALMTVLRAVQRGIRPSSRPTRDRL
ncbi:MAG TPA: MarR family winged helix-turn-helix transcriptional regulator [Candidatus Dormibacteraeota bacterium]|nr:MarR family winged helix-turn-helix transcriptional regulator [Candidatus Dormibacteraeota bacterium]